MATLLAAYNFDGSGTTVVDQSGNGNDAVLSSDALRDNGGVRFGADGQTLTLDASSKSELLPAKASVALTVDLTARTTGYVSVFAIARGYDSSTFNLYYDANERLKAVVRGTGGVALFEDTGPRTGLHDIALTYDGTTTRLYVDGVETVINTNASGDLVYGTQETYGFWESGDHRFYPETFPGDLWIDNLRLYDGALTPAEVAALVDNPVSSGGGGGGGGGVAIGGLNIAGASVGGVAVAGIAIGDTQVWPADAGGGGGGAEAGFGRWITLQETAGVAASLAPSATGILHIRPIDLDGTDWSAELDAIQIGQTITVYADGGNDSVTITVSNIYAPDPQTRRRFVPWPAEEQALKDFCLLWNNTDSSISISVSPANVHAHFQCLDPTGSTTILDGTGNGNHATIDNGSVTQLSPGLRPSAASMKVPITGLTLPFHVIIECQAFEDGGDRYVMDSNQYRVLISGTNGIARVVATGNGGTPGTRDVYSVGESYTFVMVFRPVADLPAHSAELYASIGGGAYQSDGWDDAVDDTWFTTDTAGDGWLNLMGRFDNGSFWPRLDYFDISIIEGDWTP